MFLLIAILNRATQDWHSIAVSKPLTDGKAACLRALYQ